MTTHRCIIYGLQGAGTRLVVEVPDYIAPIACTPAITSAKGSVERRLTVETILTGVSDKLRKPKGLHTNIKPVNGTKLALR